MKMKKICVAARRQDATKTKTSAAGILHGGAMKTKASAVELRDVTRTRKRIAEARAAGLEIQNTIIG